MLRLLKVTELLVKRTDDSAYFALIKTTDPKIFSNNFLNVSDFRFSVDFDRKLPKISFQCNWKTGQSAYFYFKMEINSTEPS